jgi:SSS family solute:Na+ symporter
MHVLDYLVLATYMIGVLAVGFFFYRRQRRPDEYFVADRRMSGSHIALSVVATDVGGGFSIGLGGLGFVMGLSGSWLLFTGLLGAWLSAIFLIPTIKRLGDRFGWSSFPDFLEYRYDGRARLTAAIVSTVGYGGFVGSQILAGAKLCSAAFGIEQTTAALLMALIVILYTALGGLQAVVYTDTVQWTVLLGGMALAVPAGWVHVGGWKAIGDTLPRAHFSLLNIDPTTFLQWMISIVPIWFVAMTVYQRIYATRDVKTARRAWFMAGLLEYPLLASLGVTLGMLARVAFPGADPEMGLPLLLTEVLPVGLTGLVVASYFSAIMSTADSCLLASVGNVVHDLYARYLRPDASSRRLLRLSRLWTIVIGCCSMLIALTVPKVLDAILLSYGFLVSGLFVPTLAALFWKRATATAALWAMLAGGGSAVLLQLLPHLNPLSEPAFIAIPLSAVVLIGLTMARRGLHDSPTA